MLQSKHSINSSRVCLNKMAAFSQTIFSYTFLWMKSFLFWLKFHWSLFLKVQLKITQHWFRKWFGAVQATSHYLIQCLPDSLMHIYVALGGDELIRMRHQVINLGMKIQTGRSWPQITLHGYLLHLLGGWGRVGVAVGAGGTHLQCIHCLVPYTDLGSQAMGLDA